MIFSAVGKGPAYHGPVDPSSDDQAQSRPATEPLTFRAHRLQQPSVPAAAASASVTPATPRVAPPATGFHVLGDAPAAGPGGTDQLPWLTPEELAVAPNSAPVWTRRESDGIRRAADAALARLRREAVRVAWVSAHRAAVAAGPPAPPAASPSD